ncbi:MAG: hypothetical protein QG657_2453 [Acidobacteriota bacterium]|nr:hypothetical protein [Acidobacteriota bacterium]
MQSRRVTSSPIAIQLFLTKQCNLKCSYCSADAFLINEREPELRTDEWTNLLRRLKEIQVFDLAFSGGEIFLREDIFTILETAVKCSFPKIKLTSNGTLISNDIAKQIKTINFLNIEISLDGDKETHDQIRGPGSFNKTIQGIKHLIDNGIVPNIRFTPLKSNYRKLIELLDILFSFGIKKISLNALHPTGRCNKIYEDIMLDCFVEAAELKTILFDLRKKYDDLKTSDIETFYKDLPGNYEKIKSSDQKVQQLKPCSAAHSSCSITSSGWVIPCSELFDFRGGNIRDQDILDIWKHSEAFAKIRALSDVSSDQIPYCKNCLYNVLCNSGCRADAYAVYADLFAPDPFCPYWKDQKEQGCLRIT